MSDSNRKGVINVYERSSLAFESQSEGLSISVRRQGHEIGVIYLVKNWTWLYQPNIDVLGLSSCDLREILEKVLSMNSMMVKDIE